MENPGDKKSPKKSHNSGKTFGFEQQTWGIQPTPHLSDPRIMM
jgi:hypothetical protein